MLSVARRLAPAISWQTGLAETLPFADGVFDRVVSQFGLMFFDDPTKALREMRRVAKTDGRMVVAVWGPLESTPGYAAMVNLLQRLFGTQVADALRAPFALGDPNLLRGMLADAGARKATIETVDITAHFPSLEAWVQTDVKGWTLADMIDVVSTRPSSKRRARSLVVLSSAMEPSPLIRQRTSQRLAGRAEGADRVWL